MSRVVMFLPFPQDKVEKGKDAYFLGMRDAFLAANPPANLKYPNANCTWEKKKPAGDESQWVTNIADDPEAAAIFHQLDRGEEEGETYYLTKVKPATFTKVLSAVALDDMLYICGHSSYEGGWLSLKFLRTKNEKTYADYYRIRVDLLADLIKAESLNLLHKYIKLNSCYAGGSDEIDRALARDLAKELKKRGYRNIKVGGYQYLVTVTKGTNNLKITGPLEAVTTDNGMYSGRNKVSDTFATLQGSFSLINNPCYEELMYEKDPYRIWYDGSGSCVRWNVPDNYYGTEEVQGERGRYVTKRKQIPLIKADPLDPNYVKYKEKKDAQAKWIALMESTYKKKES